MSIPVVIYAAKSTEDKHGSVADQQQQVREALPDDREVIGTYGESDQSGYRKERGPRLQAAIAAAIEAAAEHGEAELWVFHSSRLARGDGRKGRRGLGKVVFDLLYEDVIVRSVTDPEMVTPMLAGIGEKTNHEYSAALSAHTTRGIHKRQRDGKPFGGVPCGYAIERTIVDSEVRSARVVDPAGAAICEAVWSMVESGEGWGPIARSLNARGFCTKRGNPWTAPVVRDLAKSRLYLGEQGYPPLIDLERWERIQSLIDGSTPVSRQRQLGGRYAKADNALLKGIAFCAECGSPMHLRSDKSGYYTCRLRKRGTGLCDAKPVPIPVADELVLQHLDTFVGSVERWIAERVVERSDQREAHEQALRREEAALSDGQALRGKLLAEYEHQVAQGRSTAYIALEAVERKDRELEEQLSRVQSARAQLGEWVEVPDVNVALDYYTSLVDAIRRRVSGAASVREVNAALSTIVAGIWVGYDGQRLEARFAVRSLDGRDDVGLVHLQPIEGDPVEMTRQRIERRGRKALWLVGQPTDQPRSSRCSGA